MSSSLLRRFSYCFHYFLVFSSYLLSQHIQVVKGFNSIDVATTWLQGDLDVYVLSSHCSIDYSQLVCNFPNGGYMSHSGDSANPNVGEVVHFENVPCGLYEIWAHVFTASIDLIDSSPRSNVAFDDKSNSTLYSPRSPDNWWKILSIDVAQNNSQTIIYSNLTSDDFPSNPTHICHDLFVSSTSFYFPFDSVSRDNGKLGAGSIIAIAFAVLSFLMFCAYFFIRPRTRRRDSTSSNPGVPSSSVVNPSGDQPIEQVEAPPYVAKEEVINDEPPPYDAPLSSGEIKCSQCQKINRADDPFCMYCKKAFTNPI